jgi:hypothetical protein
MRRMIGKHLTVPHRFVCVTDDVPAMEAAGIEAFPIWAAPQFEAKQNYWLHNFVRLGLFDPEIGGKIGERLFSIDLDAIVRRNIDHLVSDPAPFRIMSMLNRTQLQGGMFLIEPGALTPNPWRMLTESDVVERSRRNKWIGSDQAVLSELFYRDVQRGRWPVFNEGHGVAINALDIPRDWAVFFRTGARKPWHTSRPEWAEYYKQSGRALGEKPPVEEQFTPQKRGPYCVNDWRERRAIR